MIGRRQQGKWGAVFYRTDTRQDGGCRGLLETSLSEWPWMGNAMTTASGYVTTQGLGFSKKMSFSNSYSLFFLAFETFAT